MKLLRLAFWVCLSCVVIVAAHFLYRWWEFAAASNSVLVIYLGRPSLALRYLDTSGSALLENAAMCLLVAVLSLLIATVTSLALLVLGLLSEKILRTIEGVAAYSQTIPMLVVATLCLLLEKALFRGLGLTPGVHWYCIPPVALALMFPPLANGVGAIRKTPLELRQLLTMWKVPRARRVLAVYLPLVLRDVLTGVRASATWAVGATLIAEGLLTGVDGDRATLGHALLSPLSTEGTNGKTLVVVSVATLLGFLMYLVVRGVQAMIERWMFGNANVASDDFPLQAK